METSLLLGIIGILATTVFGVLSLYVIKFRKKPGQITFLIEEVIGLFDSIVRNLPELSIKYQNEPIDQSVFLLKGCLINTGTKDITEAMMESELTISLSEGYKWLNAKQVSDSPPEVQLSILKRVHLIFNMSLFRCGEYIRLEALVEVPAQEESSEKDKSNSAEEMLEKSLNFTHRIADTREVKIETIKRYSYFSKFYYLLSLLMAVLIALWGNAAVVGIGNSEVHYWLEIDDDGTMVRVKVKPLSDGILKIEGVDEFYSARMQPSEFSAKRKFECETSRLPILKNPILLKVAAIFTLIPITGGLVMWIWASLEFRSQRLYRKFLALQ